MYVGAVLGALLEQFLLGEDDDENVDTKRASHKNTEHKNPNNMGKQYGFGFGIETIPISLEQLVKILQGQGNDKSSEYPSDLFRKYAESFRRSQSQSTPSSEAEPGTETREREENDSTI